MSLRLTSISSTPWLVRTWKPGKALLRDLDLHRAGLQGCPRGAGRGASRGWRRRARAPSRRGSRPLRRAGSGGRGAAAGAGRAAAPRRCARRVRAPGFRSRRHHLDGRLDEVAHDRVDVAAHVADLGELAGLDLHEGAARQPRQTPRDLGLAHPGGADHEDVLGGDVGGLLGGQPLPPHAVAQGDGHRALGGGLADDVAVELGHDLPRRERCRALLCSSLLAGRGMAIGLERLHHDLVVGVDADPGRDAPAPRGRSRWRSARCAAPGPGRRPGRRARRCRPRRGRRRVRERRPSPRAGSTSRLSATSRKASSRRRTRSVRQSSRELDRRPLEVAAVLLELGLELREAARRRRRWSRRSRRARCAVVKAADLAGGVLDHGGAQRDLPVARDRAAVVVADGEYGGAVEGSHRGDFHDRRANAFSIGG